MPRSPSKVLVYRLGSLGDTVVALPSLHLIARSFPHAERALLTNLVSHPQATGAASVLDGAGLIHRYFHYPAGTRNPRCLWQLWRTLRRWEPDVLVYLHPSRGASRVLRDACYFWSAGIRHLIGLPFGDRASPQFDAECSSWEAEWHRLLRCLRELGEVDPTDPANWDLGLSESERHAGLQALQPLGRVPFIVASVGAKFQAKDWGENNWAGLLERVAALLPGYGLVLVGAAAEKERGERIGSVWSGKVVNLCGGAAPRVTVAILAQASLFLGHDSGPMHLAALSSTPCVAVFSGVSRAGQWSPYGRFHRAILHRTECSPCGLEQCRREAKKCILSITVDEVFAAIESLALSDVIAPRRSGSVS